MKLPSTTTTVTGRSHHVSVRSVPRGSATSPRSFRNSPSGMRRALSLVACVLLDAVLVEIAAVAVVDDDGRETLDLEAADRFRAEVLVGHHLELLHEAREHRAGAADGAEVHTLVPGEGVLHRLRAGALADRALETEREEAGGERVHAPAGGGAHRAHHVPRPRGRGAGVVDDLALHVDGEWPARLDQRRKTPVGGVPRGVEDTGDADAVARGERFDVGVAQRRRHVLDAVRRCRDHSTASLWRWAWHSMVTATGRLVMWQG